MSDSFDKNNEVIEEEDFEGSTVFSAPEEKHDKVEKPKLLRKILIGAGALVALAGIITAIALLVAKMTPDDETSTAVPEWFLLSEYIQKDEDTDAETFNYDAFSKVDVAGKEITLNLYSKVDKEAETSVVEWYESSLPEKYTSTSTVSSIAKGALGLKYSRVIAEEQTTVDYGFSKPTYTITAKPSEKDALTITVGSQSPDKSGYYVTVSGDSKVYLVATSYITALACTDKMELCEAITVSPFSESDGSAEYYNQGSLVKFDTLEFYNKRLGKNYKFIMPEQEETATITFNTYEIIEPIKRTANENGVGEMIKLFSQGLSSAGLYSVSNTDAELKKYGLDDPDMTISIKAGKQQREISAKLQEDGDFAVIASDYEVILRVSAANLTVVDFAEDELFSVFLFIENLADVDTFKIESEEVNHTIAIKTEYDSENDNTNIIGISIDGAQVTDPQNFQDYYQFLLGVSAVDYKDMNLSGKKPEAVITMTKTTNAKDTVIEYYEAENGRYQVVVNGDQMGLIGSSSFRNILKYIENVVAEKTYNS